MKLDLTTEELEQLTDLAGRLLPIHDIATILEMEEDYLAIQLSIKDSPIAQAYNRGYLQTKAQIRKSVVDLAIAGSSPAQTLALKFIAEVEFENQ